MVTTWEMGMKTSVLTKSSSTKAPEVSSKTPASTVATHIHEGRRSETRMAMATWTFSWAQGLRPMSCSSTTAPVASAAPQQWIFPQQRPLGWQSRSWTWMQMVPSTSSSATMASEQIRYCAMMVPAASALTRTLTVAQAQHMLWRWATWISMATLISLSPTRVVTSCSCTRIALAKVLNCTPLVLASDAHHSWADTALRCALNVFQTWLQWASSGLARAARSAALWGSGLWDQTCANTARKSPAHLTTHLYPIASARTRPPGRRRAARIARAARWQTP